MIGFAVAKKVKYQQVKFGFMASMFHILQLLLSVS